MHFSRRTDTDLKDQRDFVKKSGGRVDRVEWFESQNPNVKIEADAAARALGGAAFADLTARKLSLLDEQRRLARDMNWVLERPDADGLERSAKLTRTNLVAAMAISMSPTFERDFTYYAPTQEVKRVVNANSLGKMTRRLEKMSKELSSVDNEIESARRLALEQKGAITQASRSGGRPPASVRAFNASRVADYQSWFAKYGLPKPAPAGFFTKNVPNKKTYGGTSHHKSFRSLHLPVVTGHMTR